MRAMKAVLFGSWFPDWRRILAAACLLACQAEVTRVPPEIVSLPDVAAAIDAGSSGDASACGVACVSQPEPLRPREACVGAPKLEPASDAERTRLVLSGSTAGAVDTTQSALGGCNGATLGADVWHLLDLTKMSAPVEVLAVLDANFDAALDLREGPCGDTLSRDCNRASALAEPSSSLLVRLEPGVYWLVVDGHHPESRGEFQLQVEIAARPDACSEPSATSCAQPRRLELREGTTTELLDMSCPSEDDKIFHFEIDLSSEAAAVHAGFTSWGFGEGRFARIGLYRPEAAGEGCGTLLVEEYYGTGESPVINTHLSARLDPGRYLVEVEIDGLDMAGVASPAAFSVKLDRERCRLGPRANTCETAIELSSHPGVQVVPGETACNSNHFTSYCESVEAPEQYYRLDLSAQPASTDVRMGIRVAGLEFPALLYLMSSSGAGGCGEELYCFDSMDNSEGTPLYEFTLPPAVYFIVVDGSDLGSAGRYELFVELGPGATLPCVDARILDCQFRNYLVDCCAEPENVGCARSLELCGLAQETTACVCDANPACCGAEGSRESCPGLFEACGYLCPDFAPSEYSCVASYR